MQRVRVVTNHTAEYLHRWCVREPEFGLRYESGCRTAQALLAAGRAAARVPTCEHALRVLRVHADPSCRDGYFRQLILRALSFFDQGELPELRVADPMILALILRELDMDKPQSSCVTSGKLRGALNKLRVVTWSGFSSSVDGAFALVERFGDTITELGCEVPVGDGDRDGPDRALARCTRLEALHTRINTYDPAVWTGLSQLHTLLGVDFGQMSAANIAAALPRLHTLGVVSRIEPTTDSVAGFFETLLPRLNTFRFTGPWPVSSAESESSEEILQPQQLQPLPRLQEVVWESSCVDTSVLRRFAGAHPVKLHARAALAVACLAASAEASGSSEWATAGPLARVRDLKASFIDESDVPRFLRAAPQLRRFDAGWLDGEFLWAEGDDNTTLAGLMHTRLRSLCVSLATAAEIPPQDCPARLRQKHFPRLQRLVVQGRDFFVTQSETETGSC